MLLESAADVSALNEVYVVPEVIAGSHQDTQEVEIVTQVFNKRRPRAVERKKTKVLFKDRLEKHLHNTE